MGRLRRSGTATELRKGREKGSGPVSYSISLCACPGCRAARTEMSFEAGCSSSLLQFSRNYDK